jgi:hypothetical protein
LVDQVRRSEVGRFWERHKTIAVAEKGAPGEPAERVRTAANALESLTTLVTQPGRYPAPLRRHALVAGFQMRTHLQTTKEAAGRAARGESVAELDALASRSLARCEQAIRRLDEAARGNADSNGVHNAPLPAADLSQIP